MTIARKNMTVNGRWMRMVTALRQWAHPSHEYTIIPHFRRRANLRVYGEGHAASLVDASSGSVYKDAIRGLTTVRSGGCQRFYGIQGMNCS